MLPAMLRGPPGSRHALAPALVNGLNDRPQVVAVGPVREIGAKSADIADVPDVIADPICLRIAPLEFPAADLLAQGDGFEHRAMAVPAAAGVIDRPRPRALEKVPEHANQVGGEDVVPDLLAFV